MRQKGTRLNEITARSPVSAGATATADPAARQSSRDNQEHAGKWATFAVLAIGIIMATLDSSIVNISLPTIARYFNVPLSGAIEWVIIAYLVVIAGMLLTIGRLADILGRKPLWVTGLAVFTAGSAICGASTSLLMLIIARALQGLGGALMMAVSPAMLLGAFPPNQRGRALGLNAIIVAAGVSIGPTLGGLITENFSWRWIFSVNVPLGMIGIIASLHVLKERLHRSKGRFDPLGAILLAIGLVTLTLGLSFGQEIGWTSPLLMSALVISVISLILMVLIEHRVADPVIDFRLLHNRLFLSANISLVLNFLALFAVSFMLPFYLEELRGFSTGEAGLLLTPLPLTIALVAPFSGRLSDRIGTRWLAACGLAIACIGLVLVSMLNAQSQVWDIIWRLVVVGSGQALFQSPNNSALMGAAPRERQGVASSFLATGRVVGQSISVALAGAIFGSLGGAAAGRALLQNGHNLPPAQAMALQQTFTSAFHTTFIVCAAIAAIDVFTSLTRGKENRRKKGGSSDTKP